MNRPLDDVKGADERRMSFDAKFQVLCEGRTPLRRKGCRTRKGNGVARALVGSGFGGGVHTVLRDFVDAAQGLLLVEAEELIERAGAFADCIGALDGFGDVSLRKDYGFAQV
jgi:hypothetical protein